VRACVRVYVRARACLCASTHAHCLLHGSQARGWGDGKGLHRTGGHRQSERPGHTASVTRRFRLARLPQPCPPRQGKSRAAAAPLPVFGEPPLSDAAHAVQDYTDALLAVNPLPQLAPGVHVLPFLPRRPWRVGGGGAGTSRGQARARGGCRAVVSNAYALISGDEAALLDMQNLRADAHSHPANVCVPRHAVLMLSVRLRSPFSTGADAVALPAAAFLVGVRALISLLEMSARSPG
jgi:hypothetical protein